MARQLVIQLAGDGARFQRTLRKAFTDLRRFNTDVQKAERESARINNEFRKLDQFARGGSRAIALIGENTKIVSAATGRYSTQLGALDRQLNAVTSSQQRNADAVSAFTGVSIAQAIRLTATFTAASAVIQGVTTAIADSVRLSSDYETFRTRVGALTDEYGELADAIAFTNRVANDQNVALDDVRDSYAKLLPFVNDQLVTTDELRKIFVGFNDIAARSGATNEQLSLSYYGLSQALGSTNVQMQEVRQIFEALPVATGAFVRSLEDITDGAVRSRGDLRDFAAQGKLTVDIFTQALLDSFKEFDGAAALLSDTSRASFNRLRNEYTRFLEVLNTDDIAALGADFLASALKIGRGAAGYSDAAIAAAELQTSLEAVKKTQDEFLASGDLDLATKVAALVVQYERGSLAAADLLSQVRALRENQDIAEDEIVTTERRIAELRVDQVNASDAKVIDSSIDLAKQRLEIIRDNTRSIISVETTAATTRSELIAKQIQLQKELANQLTQQVNPVSVDTDFERSLEAAKQERIARTEISEVIKTQTQLQEQLSSLSTARTDEERRTIQEQISATREQLEVQEQSIQKRVEEINSLGRAAESNVTALDTFAKASRLQQELITTQIKAADNAKSIADGLSDGLEAEGFAIEQEIKRLEELFDTLDDKVSQSPLEIDADIVKATTKLDDLEAQLARIRQPVNIDINTNTPSGVAPPGLATGGFVGRYGMTDRYDSQIYQLARGEAVISAPVVASIPKVNWEALMAGKADIVPRGKQLATPAARSSSKNGLASGGFATGSTTNMGSLQLIIAGDTGRPIPDLQVIGPEDSLRQLRTQAEIENEALL